tara:strand:- start:6026 stop:6163 length:138 start_codon:yes stop_codon:yes gene_type:complete
MRVIIRAGGEVFFQAAEKLAVAAGLGLAGTVGAQGRAPTSPRDGW